MFKKRKKYTISKTAYNRTSSEEYDEKRFSSKQGLLFDRLEWEELKRAVSKITIGSFLLEVGCGTARFSIRLAEKGFRIHAIDPSEHMIKEAYKKCRENKNVTFAQEEASKLSYKDSVFDFTFTIRVTNQTESEYYALEMVKEMIRVTKPGGLILVEFANKSKPFKKKSKSVRLSFSQIETIGKKLGCHVEEYRGILILSQTLLMRTPPFLLPLFYTIEHLSSTLFFRWSSRGYILLKKNNVS